MYATVKLLIVGVPLPEYELEIRSGNGQVFSDKEIGNVFVKGESRHARLFQ